MDSDRHEMEKLKELTVVFLLLGTLVGCAPATSADGGEWASGSSDSELPNGSLDQVPTLEPTFPNTDNQHVVAGKNFSFSSTTVKLTNANAKTWDGCNPAVRVNGGYVSDTKCGKGYFIPKYAEKLEGEFFRCAEEAALDGGYPRPQRVFINHIGTYVNRASRGSTTLSMHAYARGIDLAKIILIGSDGRRTSVGLNVRDYKGAAAKFYDSFRQCWKESMPSACKAGQREYRGSIGNPKSAMGGNNLHNTHIHLSFPFCAG